MQVRLHGLGHRFGSNPWLFRDCSLELRPSLTYALTGPSGSGKSTMLGLVAGWIDPVEGTVERDGINKVGWVFQSPHGSAKRSVIDHVSLPFLSRGLPLNDAIDRSRELLDRFGLGSRAEHKFRDLSGGEAQRLMLARSLASAPELLLVDEPTAQLDSLTARAVSHAITSLNNEETIILIATHDPATRDACSNIINLGDFADLGSTGVL